MESPKRRNQVTYALNPSPVAGRKLWKERGRNKWKNILVFET
jgi:hypothetical protein